MSSKPYSGIPLDEKRTWIVPRWMKEAFVAFAAVAVLAVGISKAVAHWGGRTERAKGAVEADDLDGHAAPDFKLPMRGGGDVQLASSLLAAPSDWARTSNESRSVRSPSTAAVVSSARSAPNAARRSASSLGVFPVRNATRGSAAESNNKILSSSATNLSRAA